MAVIVMAVAAINAIGFVVGCINRKLGNSQMMIISTGFFGPCISAIIGLAMRDAALRMADSNDKILPRPKKQEGTPRRLLIKSAT